MWLVLVLAVCLSDAAPSSKSTAAPPPGNVGSTQGFIDAGRMLAAAINSSVNPCDDFYSYACGGWIAEHAIPADRTSVSPFVLLRDRVQHELKELFESTSDTSPSRAKQMVRTIYRACLDEEAIDRSKGDDLVRGIKSIGVWPMLGGEWRPVDFDLTSLLVEVGFRGVSPFLEVSIATDPRNTSRRVFTLEQGGLGLGSSAREYYLNVTKYAKQVNAYKQYIFEKVSLIASDAGSRVSPEAVRSDIEEIFQLEQRLADALLPDEDRRNYSAQYNIRKYSQLGQLFPLIDWQRYFKSSAPFDVHGFLDADCDVLIPELDFLTRLTELLTATDPRIVTNYIFLRYTGSYGLQLDSRYEEIYQRLLKSLYGKQSRSERWKDCVNAASGKLSYATGALYVHKHFNKEAKSTTEAMIDEISTAFSELLEENTWMDEQTKKEAFKKLRSVIRNIGYPDWILDDDKLDAWYEGLDIRATDSYASTIAKSLRWSNDFAYRRLLKAVDRLEFNSNPSTVNAYYSSIRNGITFPAGILQPPFFSEDFPMALNYGGIGSIIGHELTHGFDDTGNQFDGTGNLHEWWDAATRGEFSTRAKCIIDQYSAEYVEEVQTHVNGRLTQGENIADNGGIKQAYRAYRKYLAKHGVEPRTPFVEHLSNEQLFFVGYAQVWCQNMKPETLTNLLLTDPHSPGRYRVKIVLSNQPEFAEAFDCPAGSPMNPEKRCAVW